MLFAEFMTSGNSHHRFALCATLVIAGQLVTADASFAQTPLDVLHESNALLHKFVLENGMIGLVKEDHSAPVVAVQIWVGTGSIHEQDYLGGGLSHYLEHMLFKGTTNRPPGSISKEIDGAGGDINAYTTYDRTVYHTTLPSDKWRVGLEVLGDAVMNANFPEEEWLREREVVLREVAMGRDDPNRIVNKLLMRTAFRVHPFRHPVIGHENVLTRMTRDELVDFYRLHYVPDNMITVIVGDVDAREVETTIRDFFADFHRRPRAPVVLPVEPPQASPRFGRETGAFNLSRLEWSYHTVPLSHHDTSALDVLSKILGGGRSSRLVRELVEERKLAVSADAWSWTPGENGMFGFSAVFPPENEEKLLESIQEQVDDWGSAVFTEEEIRKAQRQILVSELSGLQTAAGQARDHASGEFYAGDPSFSESYLAGINNVTAQDLAEVFDRYLRPENRTTVILSPDKQAEPEQESSESGEEMLPVRIALPGGSTLLVREDHRLPFVYFAVASGGGLLSEESERAGVTQLMADMLTRGTATRTASEIAESIESIGARLQPYSGRNSFGLTARCLSDDVDAFAGILGDCLVGPGFPQDEMDKQRDIQLAAVRQQMERPMFQAQQQLRDMLFPGHPYSWIPAGTLESVEKISRDDLLALHRELVVSSNIVLSIFGDISVERATKLAKRILIAAPSGPQMTPDTAQPSPQLPARQSREEPKEQAILLIGFPGVDVLDSRVDALNILENALSGLSSDLMIEIRDKRGLAYYAGAYMRAGREPGSVVFYTGTRPEVLEEVEGLLDEQIERVSTEGLREEELSRSRAQLIASYQKGLQDNGRLAQTCALNELYGLGYLHSFKTSERLQAVRPQDIQQVAAELLQPDLRAVSIVVPEPAASMESP